MVLVYVCGKNGVIRASREGTGKEKVEADQLISEEGGRSTINDFRVDQCEENQYTRTISFCSICREAVVICPM